MKKKIITTSWDDGHPLDIKLSELLLKYNIPGTFYVPIKNNENPTITNDEIKQLSKKFEIGGHTINHIILTGINKSDLQIELQKSKMILEKLVGSSIISFCYPRGKFNSEIKKNVKDSGYLGARTTELFSINSKDPFELDTTIQAVNRKIRSKIKQSIHSEKKMVKNLFLHKTILKNWDEIALESLNYVLEHGGIWHLWGHSWEIENNGDWEKLENLLKVVQIKGKEENAEFLTNGEIFRFLN
jgi:peptidoglycan-N-acetylglucosamine deacetylase